ncbi:flagellar filament capping protein FliD [Massilia oculi]|uniref:flagellar filament capping protein FliD n=1 Tax=Massilia oculi TaxID=945844 RepID=UPI001AAF6E11|nr:flagellar filament capping protein FliD [Massilia oculi]
MATAITAPTFDPVPTANDLADKYIASRQQILNTQTKAAAATEKGLTELNSALSAFQASLAALTGLNKTMYSQSAVFSDTTLGSATATSTAAGGTYAFFVKQLAVASQVSYTGLTDNAGVGGKLTVNMGGSTAFEVNMAAADADGNGTLSTRELAAAINAASGNDGKITASVINTGGTAELVLTSKETGANTAITLDTSLVTGGSSLAAANADPARRRVLALAQDAEIRVGSENGTAIVQASNTFTAIDGVKMTFTKVQASGDNPFTLTVGQDDKATTANVQAFVDAFNKLRTVLSGLTKPGDTANGVAGGAFSHDGGVRALNDRLTALLRPGTGESLATYGIIATRSGTLELDEDRLLAQLARNPQGLDAVMGTTAAASPSGIAGGLDQYLKTWSNSVDGQIKQRREQTSTLQTRLADRQAKLDEQHKAAYDRYLQQYTQLQTMQAQMNHNVSLFDALFGNDKD